MQCPSCNYIDGQMDFEKDEWTEGEEGKFYRLPIKLAKQEDYGLHEMRVFGCPACYIVFMYY